MRIFATIEVALSACERSIRAVEDAQMDSAETERFLVAGLVVLIVSEYEEHLEELFRRRADTSGDVHVSNFVKRTISKRFRSPDLSKINETLRSFDDSCLGKFRGEVENSRPHASWDSIMKARHAVVHKQGMLNLTFRELKERYEDSKSVLISVERSLGLID